MKEIQCKNCGAIFEIDKHIPKFECTCRGKEFTNYTRK